MKRQRISLIVIFIVLSLVLMGCNQEVTSEEDKELIVLQGVDATTLDPAMHSDTPSGNIGYQIFDTVLKRDIDMNIIQGVAKEWEMIDELTWQFSIFEDITFHNGVALTTEDIKFSIERIINPDNQSPRISHYTFIDQINVLDDHNFIITTREPAPILLSRMVSLEVVPKDYVLEVGNSKFANEPIGSGPFMFNGWTKDEKIELIANHNYFLGAPSIERVIFKPVPEAAARVMALQAGEADIIANLPPHSIKEVDAVGEVAEVASTRVIFLAFTTANSAVSDLRVRQALELAVDNESIVNNIFSGKATVSNQIISVFDVGYNSNIDNRGQDLTRAKELLEEANVENLEITLKSPSGRYAMDKEVAEAAAAQIEALGVKVNLVFEDFNNFVSKIINGTMDADLWLIGWGSNTFDAGTTLMQWLHSNNSTSYYRVDEQTNKDVDSLLEEALVTIDDITRAKLYNQVIEQVVNDCAFINLYQQNDLYGVSQKVNFRARGDEIIDIYATSWK